MNIYISDNIRARVTEFGDADFYECIKNTVYLELNHAHFRLYNSKNYELRTFLTSIQFRNEQWQR